MNNLTVFENPEFGAIRTVELDGEPWLVGKDVAQALGYTDTDQALRRHVDDEDKLTRNFDGSGQNRSMTIINESGLYSLVLSSKLPTAKKFQRWVTSEVLPSIRVPAVMWQTMNCSSKPICRLPTKAQRHCSEPRFTLSASRTS